MKAAPESRPEREIFWVKPLKQPLKTVYSLTQKAKLCNSKVFAHAWSISGSVLPSLMCVPIDPYFLP